MSLDISESDTFTRNIFLTLSVANASLLDSGEIICHGTTGRNAVMAGCLINSKFINILVYKLFR